MNVQRKRRAAYTERNVAGDLDSLLWLVVAGLVTVGYAGTAALSTVLFPMFRKWDTQAALPALYGLSAAVTVLVAWLITIG